MSAQRKNILKELQQGKKEISDYLDNYLVEWENMESDASRWRSDIRKRMQEMVKSGKMVRGSLVIKTHEFYGGEDYEDCLRVAGAIELLHTGLLMHDDIVDKDEIRRDKPTFAKQYETLAQEENISDEKHFGISMGIVGGDISFFMGQGMLADLEVDSEIRRDVTKLVFSEFSSVGLAEQVDVYSGYAPSEIDEDEIMRLYRDKTARYTFSLPFKAGALMAEVEEEEIEKLYRLGEKIGIIFQLKDDDLGLFGSEEETGKSLSSDLDENKKTLHRLKLLQKLPEEEEKKMKQRLAGELSRDDKKEIIETIEDLGIRSEVEQKMEEMADEARKDIEELNVDQDSKEFLNELTSFCLNRKK